MKEMKGLRWCYWFFETIKVVYGKVASAVIKHTKGSSNLIGFENISNSIILSNIIYRTGLKRKKDKKKNTIECYSFHERKLKMNYSEPESAAPPLIRL